MQKRVGFLIIVLAIFSLSPFDLFSLGQPGMQLAFASDRAGNGDIFLLNQQGVLTNLTNSDEGDWSPVWSPDGQYLAFTSHRSGQADIWLMNLNSGELSNLTNHPGWDYEATWSPDGQQLIFVSERDGDAELYQQAIAGGEAIQLTFNNHPDKKPHWSPDGTQVAFAAVTDGRERLYRLDLAEDIIRPLLWTDTLNGTNPVWSPSGRAVAFVGWQNHNEIGLYLFNLNTRAIAPLYLTDKWIGSLSWSNHELNEAWLFFTSRAGGNHDLTALEIATRQVVALTDNPAWDDFAALQPQSQFHPISRHSQPKAQADSAFGYGVNLADLSNAYLVEDIHFNSIKGYLNWATVEPEAGRFRWTDPDNILRAAEGANAKLLMRIHGVPNWARPADTTLSHPPTDLADFGRFMQAVAERYRGQVAAYEIWNEPNLNYEWGYRQPNPAEYTALLQVAYRAIKAVDPAAKVVSGGLAPTGDGNPPEALGVVDFIEGMYEAGAKGYFDALGSHPYTYGHGPDYDNPAEITFNQVAAQRAVMLAHNDGETPIWITEMGWVLETSWDLGQYHNQGVSQLEQARYVRRAYEKIAQDWPWVEAAFLFNLDFSTAPWYPAAEQMRWFAILNPDRTPRPAYTALRLYREADQE